VDAGPQKAYLQAVIRRRLFAFLALLTGLAALGSPAQASLAEALACHSSIAAAAHDDAGGGEAVCVQHAPLTLRASLEVEPALPELARSLALRLPVLMGIERAFE
jgi:hypothetical protein